MMNENRIDRDRTAPLDDLSPALRRAVDAVLREPMPEGLTDRSLAAARRLQTLCPEPQTPPSRRRQVTAWRVLALAASIGLVALLVWGRWGGPPGPNVAKKSTTPSETREGDPFTPDPGAILPVPEAPPVDRLPTMWAYRQAAGQSPQALDAMLDRDARWVLRPEPKSFQAGALPGSSPLTL
jgi:hypothetical protein